MTWFATALRLICYAGDSPVDGLISVRLIQADDIDEARARALELGRSLEQRYENSAREVVEWRFAQVATLDELPTAPSDALEVYSHRAEPSADEHRAGDLDPSTKPSAQSGI